MIRAKRLRDEASPEVLVDREVLRGYLEDASGAPPGQARGLVRPHSEGEASSFLRATAEPAAPVLFQAARTSLTGGAIPRDEFVLSVERLDGIGPVLREGAAGRVAVQPGVRLEDLQRHLREHGLFFPPVPTYQQAMLGGAVSTNAGGAASFKYGVTRQWVRGLRVLLFNGDLLEIERGRFLARPGEKFDLELSDGSRVELPAPDYCLPDLKKISAGYHAADPLDLIDLFIGAEGTLGLVSEVTIDLAPLPGGVLGAVAFVRSGSAALELAGELRRTAIDARSSGDPAAPDVRSIELLDRNCLKLIRDAAARDLRVPVPAEAGAALLFEVELADAPTEADFHEWLEETLAGAGGESAPERLFRILMRHDALDGLQVAFPGDERRCRALAALREAVPTRVNEILAERRREDPGIKKVGGDLIVPFDRLPEMMPFYQRGFRRRGLEHAIWGHLSDGNLHPNALARNSAEVEAGYRALLEFAEEAARLGGCPLSEHGVGRNPVKQQMMRRFLGDDALASMVRIKRALDPPWRLGRGVLFPPPDPGC